MPAVLSDHRICESDVPLKWKSIIDLLVQFEQVENDLRGVMCDSINAEPIEEVAAMKQQLIELHDDLVRESEKLLEPASLNDFDPQHDQQIFARSVLLLTQINQCVAADESIDNAGSKLLRHYKPDYYDSPSNKARLRSSLLEFDHINEEWLANVQQDIERDLVDAQRKKTLVSAICDEFGIEADREDLDHSVFRFFSACYHNTGLLEGEVKIIVTGAMIFFCIPYKDGRLLTGRFPDSSPQQRKQVGEFLKKVESFSHGQFAHFPVFGFLKGDQITPETLCALAERTGLRKENVCHELTRLISIIPLQDVDKFVAHDVWGHGWQASMLKFDGLYEQLARYADPLDIDESAKTNRPTFGGDSTYERLSFGECFQGRGDNLCLDESKLKRFIELEVSERLPVSMTPVVAEIIADVAEFKIFATGDRSVEALPSTSALKHYPAMLDLMVRDVRVYFWQATKVFRLWATKKSRQEKTITQLVANGASPEAARRETQRAVQVWNELHKVRFAREFHAKEILDEQTGNRTLEVNVFTRLALNFVGLHREMLQAYERVGNLDSGDLPVKGFRDLLLISVAVFFEEDPPRNLWRMDEYLSLRIAPMCELLIEKMKSES